MFPKVKQSVFYYGASSLTDPSGFLMQTAPGADGDAELHCWAPQPRGTAGVHHMQPTGS